MEIHIERVKINKKPENQVKSPFIWTPHRRQTPDNLKFHEDGIFSKRIFGQFRKCECGELTEEGFCKECNTRVISMSNIPDYFIDLTVKVPAKYPNYEELIEFETEGITYDDLVGIAEYRNVLFNNKVLNADEIILDKTGKYQEIKESKDTLIGVDALLHLGVTQEWIDENMTDTLGIPHPIQRPIIITDNNTPFVTAINYLYSDIIEKINNAIEMHDSQMRPMYLIAEYRTIYTIYCNILNSLIDELQNNNHSIIKCELISHPISGAVRATIVNRHDLHEDVLLIGDTMIETLYPYLYKKYRGNMKEINDALIDGNEIVLFNRPPTIAHLSVMSMRPRVASMYPFGSLEGTNGGLLKSNLESSGPYLKEDKTNYGDLERWNKDSWEDGIDNMGLRCFGLNLLMATGMNADTDGDVLLTIALYSDMAKKEAEEILPSKSYFDYTNGKIRNHIIDEFIFVDK